ncbi:MAG: VWA domain-containing protein [Anaerolineae bacterium]
MTTSEKYCRQTVRGRIVDFFSGNSVSRYNAFKWAGLLLLASILLMLALAGCAGAPTITGPRYGLAGAIPLAGTGTPGSLVEILDGDGNRVDTVTVGTNGIWTVPGQFAAGDHDLSVRAISRGRELSNSANPLVLADGNDQLLTAYGLPSMSLPSGDIGPGLLTLAGVGTAGTLIKLFANGEPLGDATVGADGNWSYDHDFTEPGTYDITAEISDPDGNVLGSVMTDQLVIMAPPAEAVPLVAIGRVAAGTFTTDDGATASGPVSWSGTGLPGSTIELWANGEKIGETFVNPAGEWSFDDVDMDLKIANNLISVRMLDADGNLIGSPVTDTLRLRADSVVDNSPATEPEEEEPEEVPAEDPLMVSIDSATSADNGISTLTGTAEPNSTVTIYLNGLPIGTVQADENGDWSLSGYMPAGTHTFTASILDDSGAVLAQSEDAELTVTGNLVDGFTAPADGALVRVVSQSEIDERAAGTFDDRYLSGSAAISMILDASWSMTLPTDSDAEADRLGVDDPNNRINIARSEMIDLVANTIPQGTPVSLRSLGNRGGNLACVTALEYPLQGMDRDAMIAALNDITPGFNTNTPLAATLANIPSDLADAGDRERVVVLLTDGDERCGGNVEAAITSLTDAGINIKLNIIGFAINDDALREKLQGWATLGNGLYFDATNASDLSAALSSSLASVYQLFDMEGQNVATGVVGAGPVEVAPGIYTIRISSVDGLTESMVVVPQGSAVQITSE